jgi:hypothetical protein
MKSFLLIAIGLAGGFAMGLGFAAAVEPGAAKSDGSAATQPAESPIARRLPNDTAPPPPAPAAAPVDPRNELERRLVLVLAKRLILEDIHEREQKRIENAAALFFLSPADQARILHYRDLVNEGKGDTLTPEQLFEWEKLDPESREGIIELERKKGGGPLGPSSEKENYLIA